MIRSLIYSITFHSVLILLTILTLPFMLRDPIDLPPIVSVELIQITDKTSIPYAPKARKIIEETKKKEEERLVSEQAPPAAKAKEKPDRIPLPNDQKEEKKIVKKKQNPEEIKPQIRQSSEFEKKEIIDTNQIAALIDKAKEVEAKMKESQANIKKIKAEGVSGSNSIKVTLDGEGEMIKIEISDDIFKEDKTIIEDLIVAAHNNAKSILKSKTNEEISKATGGFGIPGFKWPL